ncbi:hypothetical protein RSOL_434200 [Rhizoctonia solani AG-3 Rhs1AP]|uniref:Uncharacterized protein n=1 Tax=Rhizoctonia solani AG-3 Rhs1AP TaxID=1086054 RepID=X8JJP8_9AGAM|nr:hypothetical protein RSOL_434200 [Rhizoctonia solani AG-3 Rhs1AP]
MDAPAAHDFSNADFSFLPSTDADQFLQFPPNSPNSHPFSFGEAPMPSYPSYGFNAPAAVPAHGVMDTTGSTPSPRQPFIPASPMTPPLTNISGSEISGDNLSQGHGWTPTNTTPGGRSGYNSGYNSASGYVSGGGGSRSGTGSPGSSHSHSFPGYGSGLVHRSNRGAIARGMAERAAHKRRGSNAMRMATRTRMEAMARVNSADSISLPMLWSPAAVRKSAVNASSLNNAAVMTSEKALLASRTSFQSRTKRDPRWLCLTERPAISAT